MAAYAGQCIFSRMIGVNGLYDILMAIPAGGFGYGSVTGRNLDRFGKTAGRKRPGMIEAVDCFGLVFADKRMWGVAVVADRGAVVARFRPGFVLLVHDMAIGAGGWIVGHIRHPFRVQKRIRSNARRRSGDCTQNNNKPQQTFHI